METSRQDSLDKVYLIRSVLSQIADNTDQLSRLEKKCSELKTEYNQIEKQPVTLRKPPQEPNTRIDLRTIEAHTSKYKLCNPNNELVAELNANEAIIKETKEKLESDERPIMDEFRKQISVRQATQKKLEQLKKKWFVLGKKRKKAELSEKIEQLNSQERVFSKALQDISKIPNETIKELSEKNKNIEKQLQTIVRAELLQERSDTYNRQIELTNKSNQDRIDSHQSNLDKKKEELIATQEKGNLIVSETEHLLNFLRNDMKMVLDERDWKNLDLIIYELETGRADSIKEALQQADLMIRHNEMSQMMQTATEAICKSIQSGMTDIRRGMTNILRSINMQIEAQERSAREISNKFDDMLDAQKLSNALQEKANISSVQLADDISRIRELKNWEYYGI